MSKKIGLLIVEGCLILNAWDMADSNVNFKVARKDLAKILADFGDYTETLRFC